MKILSFHPYSLFDNGGSSRILRRLYQGHEPQITSLSLNSYASLPLTGNIDEKIIPLIPRHRNWMRWRIRNVAIWLRNRFFKGFSTYRVRAAASKIDFDVLHLINQGPFCAALCKGSILFEKTLWVSFHDHFSIIGSSFNDANKLWNRADRRLVISNEMGNEYKQLFGDKNFEIFTDGVLLNEISQPFSSQGEIITVYFAGLLHIDYLPLFKVLADSLDVLSEEGLKIKLILRGTQTVKFLNNRKFKVDYRPFSLDHDELKEELDSATILYLPIKFTLPDFYLYSLSTKMVGYLGAPGSIFYHGPADSAVSNLLKQSMSAVGCYTLKTDDMVKSLHNLLEDKFKVSGNAKLLAKSQFDLENIRARFWKTN